MAQKIPILILVPGILTFPYSSRNWDSRAATWSNKHGILNDRTDYYCGPISRAWHQQRRVDHVKETLQQYPEFLYERTAVVHSNGNDLIIKALADLNWPRMESLHIISGAGQADFEKNGLNYALSKGRIGKVTVYVGEKDMALRFAHSVGWMVGFGTLGLHGPKRVRQNLLDTGRVVTVKEKEYGHSTWFEPANFDGTMMNVTCDLVETSTETRRAVALVPGNPPASGTTDAPKI